MSFEKNDLSKFSQYLSLMVARVPGLSVAERTSRISGEDHAPVFTCELTCGPYKGYSCASRNKRLAKHDAAKSLVNDPAFARWIDTNAVRPLAAAARTLGVDAVESGDALRSRLDAQHIREYGIPPVLSVCNSGTRHRCVVVYGPHYIPGCGSTMADAITSAYKALDRALSVMAATIQEEQEKEKISNLEDTGNKMGDVGCEKPKIRQCHDIPDVKLAPVVALVSRPVDEVSSSVWGKMSERKCAGYDESCFNAVGDCPGEKAQEAYRDPTVTPITRTATSFHVGHMKHDGSYQTELFCGNLGGELVEYDRALMSKYKALQLDCDVLCDKKIDTLSEPVEKQLRQEVDAVYIDPIELNYRKTGLSRVIKGWSDATLGECIVPHLLERKVKSAVLITDNPSTLHVESVARAYGITLYVLDTEFKVRMWLHARRARVKESHGMRCK